MKTEVEEDDKEYLKYFEFHINIYFKFFAS